MKKQILITYPLLFLLNVSFVFSMENEQELALLAEEYNNRNPVCSVPSEVVAQIVTHHSDIYGRSVDLYHSLKIFLKLSKVCKYFNKLLTVETIGELYKGYDQKLKQKAMDYLKTRGWENKSKRKSIIALIYAGVDVNKDYGYGMLGGSYLIELAATNNDISLAQLLFKHGLNLNKGWVFELVSPIAISRTVEMAELFIANGVNVHQHNALGGNVLWSILGNEYPLELMDYYLNVKKVDTRMLTMPRGYSNFCLLHEFAHYKSYIAYIDEGINADLLLKKAHLLLSVIPDMINTVSIKKEENWDGSQTIKEKTPLDVAYKSLEKTQKKGTSEVFEQLIALFLEYGALTTQQLTEQNNTVT